MKIKLNKGFSLIEVLIALVVVGFGILAISQLQGTFIKSTSNANQRSVAVSIAQKKIDDLRSYSKLTSSTAWSPYSVATSEIAFTHIQTGASTPSGEGGAPSGSSYVAAGDIPVGNTTYTLSWTVQDYMHTAALTAPVVSTPSTGYPDMKLVAVRVDWVDEVGEAQQVILNTVIDSYPPASTALSDNSSIGDIGPQPNYTPEEAPDVIDVTVDLDNDSNRQTNKPLPDAVKTGADSNTLVTFEVVTYQNAASEIIQTRREEFQTVDCSCQFSSVNGYGFPPAHAVWDEEDNERYDYIELGTNGLAKMIEKPTATQTGNANDVDELCDVCCRDHHDDDASPVKYVPGTSSGDHTHYQADGSIAYQADGDTYVESCRFKRVDGILRVFQDWKLHDLITLDRAALANVAADGGIQDTYSNYVSDFVLNEVGVSSISPTKPDAVTDVSTTVGAAQQLQARGIYIDKVYDLDGNENPSAYTNYIYADSPVNSDRLEKIPFSEVNLSLLANWSSDDDSIISVTNEAVATIADPASDYYGTYSRGYISALAETGASGIPVTAMIADNNNGITQIVDPTNSDIDDAINVVVGPAAGNFDITGSYSFTFPNGDDTVDKVDITITGDGGVCVVTATPGNTFSCNVASPWTGDIEVEVTVNGSDKCKGTATYSGFGITSDPGASITGVCS